MGNNNDKKPLLIFRNEVQWIIFIVLFVSSILVNYFTITKEVDLNLYKISQIEEARADAWQSYSEDYDEQVKLLRIIRDDLIEIKIKLDIKK